MPKCITNHYESLPSYYMILHASTHMAKQRITITIDSNLVKKLRMKQANKIKKTKESVSLSQMFEEILKKGL